MTLIESLDRRLGVMIGNIEIPDNCIGKWAINESTDYAVKFETTYDKPAELSGIRDITISLIEIYVKRDRTGDYVAIKVNDGFHDARASPGLKNATLYAENNIHSKTTRDGTGTYINKTGLLVKLEKVDVQDENNAIFYVTWSFTQDVEQDSKSISYNCHFYKRLQLKAEKMKN